MSMLPRRTFRRCSALPVFLILGVALSAVKVRAQAARKPYTKDAILGLLKGEVSPKRVAELARQRGIDFQITAEVEGELHDAGATGALLSVLRELAPKPAAKPAQIVVETSPAAQIYLDDAFKGQASPQGRLVIDNPKPGDHTLRVSLAGKKDYERQVAVVGGQAAKVQAALADLAGSIRVQTSAGAEVLLDNSRRGTTDQSGQLVMPDVAGGAHELRVSARGKKEYRQSVTVAAGQESRIDATLADIEKPSPTVGTVRENPKDGLKYVWIPPGTFQMGCSPGDSECLADETPAHQVTLSKGFWLGQTEVTVGAYKRFARSAGKTMPQEPRFLGRALNRGWKNEAMPMANVTWDEARDYCTWAGGRLPTEAEWEYAARGGSTEARYGPLDEIAWYADNSGLRRFESERVWREDQKNYVQRLKDNANGMHEVAQKRANGFGLYDVLGNVSEWVNDWYDQNYYQNSAPEDPSGPTSGQLRVLRGGSWGNLHARSVRISNRFRLTPANRLEDNGCRCVREVDNR